MIQRSQGLCAEGWKSQVVASSLRIAADGPACRHGTSLRIVAAAHPAANARSRRPASTQRASSQRSRHAAESPQPTAHPDAPRQQLTVPSHSRRPTPTQLTPAAVPRPVTARPALFRLVATSCDVAHKKATS